VFHPNGSRVYVLGERDGSISVLDYEASTGQLREKQRVTALPPGFQGTPAAADLHRSPRLREVIVEIFFFERKERNRGVPSELLN
jgi:6-phosphogluconolactonase (cycloisomerase 2 family)